jgi:hypothetical protein
MKITIGAVACISMGLACATAWGQGASLDNDERAVLAAALAETRLKGDEKLLLVADETANFRCDGKSMINAGGCSGMRNKEQRTEDVMVWLHETFPRASPELLTDLRIKSEYPATVARPLPVPVKQLIWGRTGGDSFGVISGEPMTKQQGDPDYLITVSRVGFDSKHAEALAYIGAMSWKTAALSYGEYVYLRKAGDRWTLEGRARMWGLSH